MPKYLVEWEIDVEADNAIEAARDVAKTYFQKRISEGVPDTACSFKCHGPMGLVEVDLSTFDVGMMPDELKKVYGSEGHPRHRRHLWTDEAMIGDTELGYWDWVADKLKEAQDDLPR